MHHFQVLYVLCCVVFWYNCSNIFFILNTPTVYQLWDHCRVLKSEKFSIKMFKSLHSVLYNNTFGPVVSECWHFIILWKTLPWPHHFIWANETSLTSLLFLEVSETSHESGHILEVSILSVSTIFLLDFETVP